MAKHNPFFQLSLQDQMQFLDDEVTNFDANTSMQQVGASSVNGTTESNAKFAADRDKETSQAKSILDAMAKSQAAKATAARKAGEAAPIFANLSSQRLFKL